MSERRRRGLGPLAKLAVVNAAATVEFPEAHCSRCGKVEPDYDVM